MFVRSTSAGFARYNADRAASYPPLFAQLAHLSGLPGISAEFGGGFANQCALTPDGIEVSINPDAVEKMANGPAETRKEPLPIAVADTIVALHEIGRARDFTDPSFFVEEAEGSKVRRSATLFFNACVDDTAIDARLKAIPLVARYFDAFMSRFLPHELETLPDHIQLMHALRITLLETSPSFSASDRVTELVHSLVAKDRGPSDAFACILDPHTTFAERRRKAHEALFDTYIKLLVDDLRNFDIFTVIQLHVQQSFFGLSEVPDKGIEQRSSKDEGTYEDDMYSSVSDYLDGIDAAAIDEADSTADVDEEDEIPGLILPRVGTSESDWSPDGSSSSDYWRLARKWHDVVEDIAEVFLELSSPHDTIMVPRYKALSATSGHRLNPTSMLDAFIQLETGVPQAIWQPLRWKPRIQELEFSGLDIMLLLDVSASMSGENAEHAAATSACLIEGLDLARSRAQRDSTMREVDVRTQLLAFGEGWAPLTPLQHVLESARKEEACYNLLNPKSNFTLVNGALKQVSGCALAHPERSLVCLTISDGLFSDNLPAIKTVRDMPPNVYFGHVNIGPTSSIPITRNYESIRTPKRLPQKLKSLLSGYLIRMQKQ